MEMVADRRSDQPWIMRLDQSFDRDPRHHGCHPSQKHISVRVLARIIERRETQLVPSERLPESMIEECLVQSFPKPSVTDKAGRREEIGPEPARAAEIMTGSPA
jgi:hypothetical protein